ncbi:ABC transporter permease [Nocardioides sp. MAH-18]|uniref:Xylose transport system permease protein XylH n=1 Tax=Nocardioides agri TaxID=2682843 RepID=A0A6L6XL87_9ACTN|nr:MULTISPECIES: ABC transporter permease [unclassified Nocardioides]MBA2953074.1 ABC transporter permease [Nocardioides sp. CGMCC 1.13656]MVQ47944.1 ABC transporter permease [Nocardioides sp. MAH-18]
MSATTQAPPEERASLGSIARGYLDKVRGGDVGSLPAVLGLIALVIVFSVLRPDTFTTELNFANLIGQSAAVMVLAMGLIFVLLLGEIDLSAGFTGGAAAAVLGVTLTNHDWPLVPALLAGILTGTLIGLFIGLLVARVGIPSFVVTLALFLALQGVMLWIIGEGGTIGLRSEFVLKLNNGSMPIWLGWLLTVLTVVGYAGTNLLKIRTRRAKGLSAEPMLLWAIKSGAFAILVVAFTAYLSRERSPNPALKSLKGVPNVVVIILALVVLLGYALSRTSWGKHVYATGGNAEAARRSGIAVPWVKISCFMTCSTIAALAGFLAASRTNSVSPNTGGSDTLLLAVGAAVIGGTSLFGGKGKITDAVIGGLVVAVIRNGIILLDQPSSVYYMVTGAVLLLAASVDAISRRRATASGRV